LCSIRRSVIYHKLSRQAVAVTATHCNTVPLRHIVLQHTDASGSTVELESHDIKGPTLTARSREDETRNGQRKANRNPEWWGDFSQLQNQIKPNPQFEFVPRDTSDLGIPIQSKSLFDFVP